MIIAGCFILVTYISVHHPFSVPTVLYRSDWRRGQVTPIYKVRGDRKDCNNYHGFNLILCLNHILGHLVLTKHPELALRSRDQRLTGSLGCGPNWLSLIIDGVYWQLMSGSRRFSTWGIGDHSGTFCTDAELLQGFTLWYRPFESAIKSKFCYTFIWYD